MKRYYANLLGNWTDITDTATVMNGNAPAAFFEDHPEYLSGEFATVQGSNCFISVELNGKQYMIHPTCIQYVNEA